MPKFANKTKVKVINGPNKGKTGEVLMTSLKTCTVKTNEGTFHINERDLEVK